MTQERFHVNKKGNVGPCGAKINCPYGNLETDHFDTEREARAAYEKGNLDHVFATLSKNLDEVVDPHFDSDQELLDGIEKAGWEKFDPEAFRENMGSGRPIIEVDVDGVLGSYGSAGKDHEAWVRLEGGESVAEVAERLKIKYSADDKLLAAIRKAGWKTFDPSKGSEQLDYKAGALHEIMKDAQIEFIDPSGASPAVQDALRKLVDNKGDGYEASVDRVVAASNPQEDMPEGYGTLTDEDMQEMDANLSAVRKVDVYTDWDSDDNPVYEVNVSDYGTFLTGDSDAAEATTRAAAAGQWGEIEAWDEHPETKLRMVARNLENPEGLDDRKKSNEHELSTLNDENDTLSYKRFKLNLDNAMIDVAQKTLLDEDAKKSGRAMLDDSAEPPF